MPANRLPRLAATRRRRPRPLAEATYAIRVHWVDADGTEQSSVVSSGTIAVARRVIAAERDTLALLEAEGD